MTDETDGAILATARVAAGSRYPVFRERVALGESDQQSSHCSSTGPTDAGPVHGFPRHAGALCNGARRQKTDSHRFFRGIDAAIDRGQPLAWQPASVAVPSRAWNRVDKSEFRNVGGKTGNELHHMYAVDIVVCRPTPRIPGGPHRRKLCVYYCTDDYAAHPGVDRKVVTRLDEYLTRKADVVFVAPPAIVEAKKALNPHTTFSPHGVDADLFGRARDPATAMPEVAKRLSHPVVGFFGLVGDWIDVDLIAFLARERPTWSFLLVGHVYADTQGLERARKCGDGRCAAAMKACPAGQRHSTWPSFLTVTTSKPATPIR